MKSNKKVIFSPEVNQKEKNKPSIEVKSSARSLINSSIINNVKHPRLRTLSNNLDLKQYNNKIDDSIQEYMNTLDNMLNDVSFNKNEQLDSNSLVIQHFFDKDEENKEYKAEEIYLYSKYKRNVINHNKEIISFKRGFSIHEYWVYYTEGEKVILEYKPKLYLYYPKTGITILENEINRHSISLTILRRGMRKIFEWDPIFLNTKEKFTKYENNKRMLVLEPIFKEIELAISRESDLILEIFSIRKVAGFNCSVGYNNIINAWVISYDIHTGIIRNIKDIELLYANDKRNTLFLRAFARYWIKVIDYLSDTSLLESFILDINDHTLVGEMVGSSLFWQFIKYKHEVVFFHSLIKNNSTDYCCSLNKTYKLLFKYNLYYSPFKIIDKIRITYEELLIIYNKPKSSYEIQLNPLDILFIRLNDVYYKERSGQLTKNERGCVIHIYSTIVKRENNKLMNKEQVTKREKIKAYVKKFNNIVNDSNAEENKANIVNIIHKEKFIIGKENKRLLTVFQIKCNEYFFYKELTSSLYSLVEDMGKEKNFYNFNSDIYSSFFKSKIKKYIYKEYYEIQKTPFAYLFYYEITENVFKEVMNKAQMIFYSRKTNKRICEILYNIIKKALLRHNITNHSGFTSNLFTYSNTLKLIRNNSEKRQSKNTINFNLNDDKEVNCSILSNRDLIIISNESNKSKKMSGENREINENQAVNKDNEKLTGKVKSDLIVKKENKVITSGSSFSAKSVCCNIY